MPETPRDPRQLARDILSGKISIEDLAREQRRRAEARAAAQGGVPRPTPSQNVPPKIPLPRPVQAKPFQPKPVPPRNAPQLQRPLQRPPVGGGGGMQRPAVRGPALRPPERKPAGPNVTIGRGPATVKGAVLTTPALSAVPTPAAARTQSAAYAGPKGTRPLGLRALVKDRAALRRAVVMAEILGKPLALRDE